MASVAWDRTLPGIWRYSRRDSLLVALAALHALVLVVWPLAPVIAVGVWWNANTIAHNFIHRPFFRAAGMNRLFSAALTLLLGFPQTLWRDRHLAHHAGIEWRFRVSRHLCLEAALVLCLWSALAARNPRFFLTVYLPGWLGGLALCALQGHWEHAVGRPTSHYGRVYNFLCLNDGYHAEHHADPAVHWTALPRNHEAGAAASPWPPLLRWLDLLPLEALERLVLHSARLQRFVLRRHRRAFQALLPHAGHIRRVTIVGGGLYPRTALILRELLPTAHLTIVDSNPRNLQTARAFLDGEIEYRNERYFPGESRDCDLTVIPLCLRGDRAAIYRHPPSPAVLVHDWIWRRRACGAVISLPLLKRLNLITREATTHRPNPSRDRKETRNAPSKRPRAPALLLILLLAKLIMIWAHPAPFTAWSLLAYTWQDASIALAFAAFEFALPSRIARPAYWALVLYTAINIPVARVVSTPLTRPMLRAARGPLADSILIYVTAANIAIVLTVLAAAALLPRLLRRVPRIWIIALFPLTLLGPAASRRVDTRGMDRNAITALIGSRVPPITANPEAAGWRTSPFASRYETADLSRFAGTARGFNVVLVSLESTAAQYLSLYGAPGGKLDPMPNLSELARRSLVFESAYAVYPESIKGLFSVLCSTFPAFDSRPEAYENIGPPSLAAILAGAGYRTAMFHSGRFGYLGMESIIRHRGYQILEDAGNISGNHNSSFGVDEPATVTRMLSWIDALPRGRNFFLTYLPIAGHHPYATPNPGPFAATAEVDQYRNALHYGDASLGTLVEGLRARGLEQNTIWIVYGDHGEAFGQHNGNYGHTFLLYDENVRVPFLIAAPGLMRGQQRVRKVVSLVDTAPTVLALLGIPPPANYQGATMLDTTPRMALFFADYSLGLLGLRDGPWKFVYELNSGRAKLFDLDRDPAEISDVSTRYPAQITWYTSALRAWSSAQQRHIARAVPN